MAASSYSPYVPPVLGPVHEMSREDATRSFDDFMSHRGDRLVELQRAVGRDFVVEATRDSLARVEDWMRNEVAADPLDSERLTPMSYALCFDVGILLGEVMIAEFPVLVWELSLAGGPSSVYFQRPVVAGFRKVKNRDYVVDPEMLVIGRAYDFAADRSAPAGVFTSILDQARKRA